MKLKKLRLTLDVAFNPNGVNMPVLRGNLEQVVKDAVGNGTLTSDTFATVERYTFKVTEIRPRRKKIKKKSNVVHQFSYKGHTIFICEADEGLYASIADENGKYIDSTPFRHDVESVKEAAENIIDQK